MRCERWLLLLALVLSVSVTPAAATARTALADGWTLQSAAKVAARGEEVSRPGFPTTGWHAVTVPNTVVGALVENGTYPDPYFGMNLRKHPGDDLPDRRALHAACPRPTTARSSRPGGTGREVALPQRLAGRSLALHFDGINYRASVWFNGTRIGSPDQVVGVFRRFEFDVTGLARPGETNVVAVEVTGPEPHDLAIMWVDWNPTPAGQEHGPLGRRLPHRQRAARAAQSARGDRSRAAVPAARAADRHGRGPEHDRPPGGRAWCAGRSRPRSSQSASP